MFYLRAKYADSTRTSFVVNLTGNLGDREKACPFKDLEAAMATWARVRNLYDVEARPEIVYDDSLPTLQFYTSVQSETRKGVQYAVVYDLDRGWLCQCSDWLFRGGPCRHVKEAQERRETLLNRPLYWTKEKESQKETQIVLSWGSGPNLLKSFVGPGRTWLYTTDPKEALHFETEDEAMKRLLSETRISGAKDRSWNSALRVREVAIP